MRVRALDENWDMTFGAGSANFLINSPAAVAQCVRTRLLLFTGEWFLDVPDGTPWIGQIFGVGTAATRDQAIKSRILGTQGVTSILNYSGTAQGRRYTVTAQIQTIYGVATLTVTL
jgi:hypothetical protein